VAPVDGGAQGLLAGHRRAVAPRKQPELVAQAVEDLGGREHVDPGRGQLDGEGDAVEAAADVGDGVAVVVGEGEGAVAKPGPVGEQLDALRRCHAWNAKHDLAWNAQGLLTGGDHLHAPTSLQQEVGELGHAGQHVLAVVDEQEEALGRQRLGEGRLEMTPGLLAHTKGRREHVG
jgi:hypothetical protein